MYILNLRFNYELVFRLYKQWLSKPHFYHFHLISWCPEGFDSRLVAAGGEGVLHVVASPDQILPYCLLQLRKESLTGGYRLPLAPPPPPQAALTAPVAAGGGEEENKK